MGRIILGLLASLLVVCSLPARANTLEPPLYDLLLRPDHPSGTIKTPKTPYGTIKQYPSLCWILRNRPPVDATMMFTLMDSRSIKPVLEIRLPNSIQTEKNETCDCVNLKDYDILLEPDILYRWSIWIARNPESHSRDVVVAGLIERCSEASCSIGEMPLRCDQNSFRLLASRGFWYESISCLCELIKSSPDDKTLRRMLDALMRQADLELNPN
jgi:Domain of Unknown Function (DUF928)